MFNYRYQSIKDFCNVLEKYDSLLQTSFQLDYLEMDQAEHCRSIVSEIRIIY